MPEECHVQLISSAQEPSGDDDGGKQAVIWL